jgi:hypothetical protein
MSRRLFPGGRLRRQAGQTGKLAVNPGDAFDLAFGREPFIKALIAEI